MVPLASNHGRSAPAATPTKVPVPEMCLWVPTISFEVDSFGRLWITMLIQMVSSSGQVDIQHTGELLEAQLTNSILSTSWRERYPGFQEVVPPYRPSNTT